MRPISARKLALAAGAALAGLAAPGLAAAADFYLKIQGTAGEVWNQPLQSFSWGTTQTSTSGVGGGMGAGKVKKVDSITVKQSVAETAVGDEARKRPGGVKFDEITLKRGDSAAAEGGVWVATGDLDNDGRADRSAPRDVATGQSSGRANLNSSKSNRVDQTGAGETVREPLPTGSVRIEVKLPWPGCTEGARYPAAELVAAGSIYELKEVVISSCAPDALTLNYSKVKVRAWNPTKKEE